MRPPVLLGVGPITSEDAPADTPIVRPDPLPQRVSLIPAGPGEFDDATGWSTHVGVTIDTEAGKAVVDGTQAGQVSHQLALPANLAEGAHYSVIAGHRERTAGQIQVGFGGDGFVIAPGSTAAARNAIWNVTAAGAHSVVRLTYSADFVGEVDFFRAYPLAELLTGPHDIYILAGQSNMAGISAGEPDVEIDVPETRALYMPSWEFTALGAYTDNSGAEINANLHAKEGIGEPKMMGEPVQHAKADSNGCSPSTEFARGIADGTPAGRVPLIVACAAGSTQLLGDGHWDPEADARYYDLMVAQVNAALALNEGNVVKGMVWCQGESDGATGYAAKFRSVVLGLRTLWATDFPVVVAEIGDDAVTSANMIAEQKKLQTGSGSDDSLAHCLYVARPVGAVLAADGVHFDQATNRVRGADWAEAMLRLIYPGTAVRDIPGAVE